MPGSMLVSSARTPIGKLSGALASFPASDLGGLAIAAALERAGLSPDQVDQVVMGQVLTAGQGQNPARQAAVKGGIPMEVPAVTLNKVCLSGIHAIHLADQLIQSGEADVVVAGGIESMTHAPHLLPGQPPAPRRTGAGERQDRPGARGHLPGRRVERHQGDLGLPLGRPSGRRCRRRAPRSAQHHPRRRVPEVLGRGPGLRPGSLLRRRGRLEAMVADLPDNDAVFALSRGGHDPRKLYAAYAAATSHSGAPSVVLAKSVKGWGLGAEIESRNAAHQMKKMPQPQLVAMRDRLGLGDVVSDEALEAKLPPYCRPAQGTPEHEYLHARRKAHGGSLPRRVVRAKPIGLPAPAAFEDLLGGSGKRAVSTTMAFAGLLKSLLRDETVGKRVVPIISDEGRTFGLDALFGEVRIYNPSGQRYEPVDGAMKLAYRESTDGQILEEGITESGSMASFAAAGTSYATWGEPTIPFYIFYSMFGFQRAGDLIWAVGDLRGRGFLLGATAGRTTLNGEGLQHQDGHSLLLASTVPNLAAYDPSFAYEVATIVRNGLDRMYGETQEDVFYYLTLYNENYPMPPMPEGVQEGILKGIYRFAEAPEGPSRQAVILFSGTAQGPAREAQQVLAEHHDVAAELWSVTSYKALREDALAAVRWNRLHPSGLVRTPYVTEVLSGSDGPFVAVTDFMKAIPDQVARWVPGHLTTLGTDGYGRSDSRAALRRHFETDAAHLVITVLAALAQLGDAKAEEVDDAIARYHVDPEAVEPWKA